MHLGDVAIWLDYSTPVVDMSSRRNDNASSVRSIRLQVRPMAGAGGICAYCMSRCHSKPDDISRSIVNKREDRRSRESVHTVVRGAASWCLPRFGTRPRAAPKAACGVEGWSGAPRAALQIIEDVTEAVTTPCCWTFSKNLFIV